MYKYISTLSGALVAPLPYDVNTMVVPTAVADHFLSVLDFDSGDYTYITVFEGSFLEEIKVVGAEAGEVAYLLLERDNGIEFSSGANYDTAVNNSAMLDIAAASAMPTIRGAGVVRVTQDSNEVEIYVPAVNIMGGRGIDVYGNYPNYTVDVTLQTACGGGGGGGGGDVQNIDLNLSGIIDGYASGHYLSLYLDAPYFSGTGINIEGSWPYYTFSIDGDSGGSMTVEAGAGLSQTGSPTSNTTLFITNTGVQAGQYGDITVNARGQITAIAVGFAPISDIVAGEGVEVSRTAGSVTVAAAAAAVGVVGAVALADADDSLDPNDETTAVTPKLLASVIADLESGQLMGSQSYSGEADADYSYLVPTTPFSVVLEAGETAVVHANITIRDNGNPTVPQSYGLAAFSAVANTRLFADRIIPQCNQSMSFTISGPYNDGIALKTTALPGGATVNSYAVNVVKI